MFKSIINLIKKRIFVVLIVLVIAGLFFYQRAQSKSDTAFTTITPERRSISQTLEISGYIDAHEHVELFFPTTARLSWVGVKEGDRVKKWQAIATVDTSQLQKQLEMDFNTFESQWRDHAQDIDDTDFYSASGLTDDFKRIMEKSHFDLQNAAKQVELRKLAISLSTLIAPFDGLVTQIDQPFAGSTIAITDVFEIVNPDTLYFSAEIDETDIAQIKEGLKATITLDAYEDRQIESTIDSIEYTSSISEGGSTVFRTKLNLPASEEDVTYRIGMNGDAQIIISQVADALTVPIEAVFYEADQAQVRVMKDGKPEIIPVTTGIETDDHVEILSGITELDQIAIEVAE